MGNGTYAFVGHFREDCRHVLSPVSSLTADKDLGALRDGVLDVLTRQLLSR